MNNEIFEHNIKCLMNAIVQKIERKDFITYGEEQEIQSIVEAVFYQSLDELVKENKQLQQELQRKDNIINGLKEWLNEPQITYNLDATEFGIEKIECVSVKDTLNKINELERKGKL